MKGNYGGLGPKCQHIELRAAAAVGAAAFTTATPTEDACDENDSAICSALESSVCMHTIACTRLVWRTVAHVTSEPDVSMTSLAGSVGPGSTGDAGSGNARRASWGNGVMIAAVC